MLRITKLTDYAIVLASKMAKARCALSCRQLAEETGLPRPTVAKILKTLSRAELVAATRGVTGGYTLTRDAAQISVGELIEAIEGPISVTECTDESTHACTREPRCGLRANWQRINGALGQALSAVSLAEMVCPEGPQHLPAELVQLRRPDCP